MTDPLDDFLEQNQSPQEDEEPEQEVKISWKFARPDGEEIFTPGAQYTYDDGDDPESGIVRIMVKNGDFTHKAAKAIVKNNVYGVYQSQDEVVELIEKPSPHLRPITADRMMVVLDDCVPLIKTKLVKSKDQQRIIIREPVNADKRLAQLAVANIAEKLKPISVVTEYPSYLKGWEISKPGYNVGGIYYVEPLELEQLPEKIKKPITPEKCRKWLDNLLIDFPFADEENKTRFIALMLSCLIRPALDHNTPFFLVQAPRERTGKSKLINEVLGPTILGKAPWNSSFPKEERELNKTIIAMLIDGQPIFFFDNIETEVGGDLFCTLLTQRKVQGRILGLSKTATCQNDAIIIGTSNNATLHKDMQGRTIEITLVTDTPSPELRNDFHHPDIQEHATKHRLTTLHVLFSMIENWRNAGYPTNETKIIGSFERWSKTIGGILKTNGYDQHYLQHWNMEKPDIDNQLAEFMEAWWEEMPAANGMVTATSEELLEIAKESAYFAALSDDHKYRNKHAQRTALGKMMGKILNRPVNTKNGFGKIRKTQSRPAIYTLTMEQKKWHAD